MFQTRRSEENDSSNVLVKLGFARVATKQRCIQFHEIIKSYARKKADVEVAYAMLHAINAKGSIPEHNEHIWATCFLLFKFGTKLALLKPKASELVYFIKQMALPLATYTFTKFSRCSTALELLRLCSNALENVEGPFLAHIDEAFNKSSCWGSSYTPTKEFNACIYHECATLKATLLEIRAKLMLQGGDHAIGQQLCGQSISIREVLYGSDHPETISVCNTMSELFRAQEYS
ncbi:Tir-nbs disease resistance-like protein [Thalictrum thalictroides]|uniref:Tir-nbs disease resistance-like protein n=1 Tax=Thalictrum thalictroides TaxID=46969 RepID=A0A7J6WR32_THATH|nr:Tir-nbs disease resistance-like protein [Thalictrum thalictroides]